MTYIPLAHGFSCVRYRGSLLCSSDLVRICLNISLPSFSSSLPLAIILLADNFTSKLNFACVELLFFYGTHTHDLLTSVFWSLNLLHFSWWESPLNPMSVFLWCGHFILWIPLNIVAEYNIRICSTLSQEAAFSMELTVFFRKEKKKAQNQKWYVKAKAWGELVSVGLWGKAWRFHVLLVNEVWEDTHVFISVFLKSWARIKPWLPIWSHGIHSHFLFSSVTSDLLSVLPQMLVYLLNHLNDQPLIMAVTLPHTFLLLKLVAQIWAVIVLHRHHSHASWILMSCGRHPTGAPFTLLRLISLVMELSLCKEGQPTFTQVLSSYTAWPLFFLVPWS